MTRPTVHLGTTDRSDGDFASGVPAFDHAARRSSVVDRTWVWVHQVHGARVAVVGDDPAAVRGTDADALVTDRTGVVLEVRTADCVPVFLWDDRGVIGVAHAGWRGVEAGVVQAAAAAMRELGARRVTGRIGPHLRVECNEFGARDLDRLAARFGSQVRGVTSGGAPAFDIDVALEVAIDEAGIDLVGSDRTCTGCAADRWYSHRVRRDAARMASWIWQGKP